MELTTLERRQIQVFAMYSELATIAWCQEDISSRLPLPSSNNLE